MTFLDEKLEFRKNKMLISGEFFCACTEIDFRSKELKGNKFPECSRFW